MRVYHLLPAKHGLDDLKRRRLKIAKFADLNDPFELLGVELTDRAARRRFAAWRQKAQAEYGVLCFSRSWKSPVLWSHYADRHKGLCLGFDVPDDLLRDVSYVDSRGPIGDFLHLLSSTANEAGPLFYTKFRHWQYEDEVRRILRLNTAVKQGRHYFSFFDRDLQLAEVVTGARCNIKESQLKRSLDDYDHEVPLTKARLAFSHFGVVTQQLGRRRGASPSIAQGFP